MLHRKSSGAPPRIVRFGAFEYDPHTGELRKHGMRIKLRGQPNDLLAVLLEHPCEVVTREELQKRLWPANVFVDFEHSLNAAVKRLRAALGDSADSPRFVETVAGRGYRFIAPLDLSLAIPPNGPPEVAVSELPHTRKRRPTWAMGLAAVFGLLLPRTHSIYPVADSLRVLPD